MAATQKTFILFTVIAVTTVLYLMCVRGRYAEHQRPQYGEVPTRTPVPSHSTAPRARDLPGRSRILYLIQTEQCLPSHLSSARALGNTLDCSCDVAVLSYKEICTNASLAHVNYIFNSSTTWTTGRNLLYETYIRNSPEPYLYYVMMDDDIDIEWKSKSKNPWRGFEEFLKRVEPAVVGIDGPDRNQSCATRPEYNPTVWYDAAFNAFHFKAVHHLLPYWSEMDNSNWWLSQVYHIILSELLFPGQVVVHKKLIAHNSKHRPYPRKNYASAFPPAIPKMVADIRKKIPKECQNTPILQAWEKGTVQHGKWKSSTYCLPPPLPKQPICPNVCDAGNFQKPSTKFCTNDP